MKRTTPISVIAAFTSLMIVAGFVAYAESPISEPMHSPHDDEALRPAVSFSRAAVQDTDSIEGKLISIIPGLFSADDSNGATIYIDGDTVSYVQFATKYKFLLSSDTLLYSGFENRSTSFSLDTPVAVMGLRLKDRDNFAEEWRGTVFTHGRNVLKRVKGVSKTVIDRGWTLKDGTDTISNVTLARWVLDMAYVDPDSISAESPDSIRPESVSDLIVPMERIMTERVLTERSIWFCDEARYPVLTLTSISQIKPSETGVCDTVPVSTLAMYYSPVYQQSDTGEEIARKKKQGNDNGETSPYSADSVADISEPTVTGNTVELTVSSPQGPGDLGISLFTDSGIRLGETVTVRAGTIPATVSLDIPEGYRGVILIHIDSPQGQTTRKVII